MPTGSRAEKQPPGPPGGRPPRPWAVGGPGIAVAATGVGAGDLVAAAVCGAAHGHALLWTAVAGAFLKFALTHGLARWQLWTGTTVLEGWVERLGRGVAALVLGYLVLWTLIVAAALMSACGLALHAVVPGVSVATGAVLHGLAGLAAVWTGRYRPFEAAMKGFVALIFVSILAALWMAPPSPAALAGLIPRAPAGTLPYALAVLGGVGGTVTLLSYGYWMGERGWHDRRFLHAVRIDLGVAYALTGVFGVGVMLLAADVLHAAGLEVRGREAVVIMAEMLGERAGAVGRAVFIAGFWGAVASSLLGVWQGVPYIAADLWAHWRRRAGGEGAAAPATRTPVTRTPVYRGYLLFMTFPPMLFLFLEPVGLVVAYAALGALFMPFLAATLLWMLNRRRWTGGERNGWGSNLLLGLSLLVFGFLGVRALLRLWGG